MLESLLTSVYILLSLAHLNVESATRMEGIVACNETCPPISEEVCGNDDHRYRNKCFLHQAKMCRNARLALSECETTQAIVEQCHIASCPLQSDPVCGNDGNTYKNVCILEVAQECRNLFLDMSHSGPCKQRESLCNLYTCSDERAPICGTDNTTYHNVCHFMKAVFCENPILEISFFGPCQDVEETTTVDECSVQHCGSGFDPVCGSDGRTHQNLCVFQVKKKCEGTAMEVANTGPCIQKGPTCTGLKCSDERRPVCGENNQTFLNECHLMREQCDNPSLQMSYPRQCVSGFLHQLFYAFHYTFGL